MENEQEKKDSAAPRKSPDISWQFVFDALLDPIAIIESDGTIKHCNRAFSHFVGLNAGDVERQKCYRLIHKTDDYIEGCPLIKSSLSGKEETLLMSLEDNSLYVVVDPIKSDSGQIVGFIHTIRDITELKSAEKQRLISEAKYQKLHESMMDCFVYVDMQGFIKECNKSYQEMLGYSFDELSKLTYVDLTPEKWHAFEQKIVEEQILPKGFSDIYEKEYRKKTELYFLSNFGHFL